MTICTLVESMVNEHIPPAGIGVLNRLQYPHGLFAASSHDSKTGYNNVWLRDNVYTSLAFESVDDRYTLRRIYQSILDILNNHEGKIDQAIAKKPVHHYEYIHPRYSPYLGELWDEWGNKQNDAIGAVLFKIFDLERKDVHILRGGKDLRILQKVVDYLAAIEYWKCPDHGMWEYKEEVRSSSIGACLAGLKKAQYFVAVPNHLIYHGEQSLQKLLPNESSSRYVDMAQLSLIFPFNIVDKGMAKQILDRTEETLVKEHGLIRYKGDWYYLDGSEAQWPMGFAWMALCYKQLKNNEKRQHYLTKTIKQLTPDGEMPELYYSNPKKINENTPLTWAQALLITAAQN